MKKEPLTDYDLRKMLGAIIERTREEYSDICDDIESSKKKLIGIAEENNFATCLLNRLKKESEK